MSTLVGLWQVPELPADPDALAPAATALSAAVSGLEQHARDAETRWTGLPDVFDTPDTSTLETGMRLVTAAADDFAGSLRHAATAISVLAETLADARYRIDRLRAEILQLRQQVISYRSELAEQYDLDGVGGAWGPGQYDWNLRLQAECVDVQIVLDRAADDCERALRRIDPAPHRVESALGGVGLPASIGTTQQQQERFEAGLALTILNRLASDGAADATGLLRRHPEWFAALVDHSLAPDDVAAWWTALDPGSAAALTLAAPALIGNLGGVPAAIRASANRTAADRRLQQVADEIARLKIAGIDVRADGPYSHQAAAAAYLARLSALDAEHAYLQRVADGEVRLYAYRPERETIIEMFGDPERATAILSFMPGTNTTMESFYASTAQAGITALTDWEVRNADPNFPIAGFVVKQGAFPQLSLDILATGPQNNDMTEVLGVRYAEFVDELRAVSPDAPIVSVEHSFGSAVGGEAERLGAGFDTRIMLAGIGMTDAWRPDPATDHYALQAPNDINRHLDGIQAGNWGYAISPSEANGVTELDPAIPGTPLWAQLAAPFSPTIAAVADIVSGLDHHNQIISGNPAENRTVLRQLQSTLREVAG